MQTNKLLEQYFRKKIESIRVPARPSLIWGAVPALTARLCAGDLVLIGAASLHFFFTEPWIISPGIGPFFRILF